MTDKPESSLALRRMLVLALILLLSVQFHFTLWPAFPPDFPIFQLPWFDHLVRHGPLDAFSEPFSNYSPPYLYLLALASLTTPWLSPFDAIKLLSVAISLWLAFAAYRCAKAAGAGEPVIAGAGVLLLPTVVVNGALLGQCDALWVAPILLALAALMEERPRAMLLWVGFAFAIKAQAAFIAPLVFAWLLQRRAPLTWWLIPVASYLLLLLPAWALGWPLGNLLTVYVRQGQAYGDFISNAASLWSFGAVLAPEAAKAILPLGLAVAAAASLSLAWLLRGRLEERPLLLAAALFCALFVPFVLPKMHERYTLLADLIAVILAFAFRQPATLLIVALVQFGSLAATAAYIFDRPSWLLAGSAAAGMALVALARICWHPDARDVHADP